MEISRCKSFNSENDDTTVIQSISETEVEKNLKFTLFYIILFVIIFITNLIYFNAPNHKLENFVEDVKIFDLNIYSLYKVTSRHTDKNSKVSFILKFINL